MEIGIMGLPQTGKKTLFALLTEGSLKGNAPHQKGKKDPGIGISIVYDERLYRLAKIYNPKKVIPATIKYILLPKLSKNSEENRTVFRSITTVDAICQVVRAFDDDRIFHIDGSIDPARDIDYVESELLLNDLIFTEARIERIKKEIKHRNNLAMKKELEIMEHIIEQLNNEVPLRLVKFTDDEKKIINAYPYLTRKNMLIVLNVGEDDLNSNKLIAQLEKKFSSKGMYFVQVSCKIEMELSEIEDKEEKEAFLQELGIKHSALEKVTQMSYKALGLLSFFTVGKDEVRAWTIRNNTLAPQAGGVVHSDIERGFIRAEHMRIEDLLELGSEAKVRENGKLSLKGRDYIVQDGDVLNFLFNV